MKKIVRSISFTKPLLEKIKEEENETGLNRSDIVRRILDQYFDLKTRHQNEK